MGTFPGDSFRTITSEREYQIVSFGMAGNCSHVCNFNKRQGCRDMLPPQSSKKLSATTCSLRRKTVAWDFPINEIQLIQTTTFVRLQSVWYFETCFSVGKQSYFAVKALVWVLISSHRKTEKATWLTDCDFTEDFKLQEIQGK